MKTTCIKYAFFVSKHGTYPAMWSLVNIHLSTVSKPQMAEADLCMVLKGLRILWKQSEGTMGLVP